MKTRLLNAIVLSVALTCFTADAPATQWEMGLRIVRGDSAVALPVYLYHPGDLNVPIRTGVSLGVLGDYGVNFKCDIEDPPYQEPSYSDAQCRYIKPGQYVLRVENKCTFLTIKPMSQAIYRDFNILCTETGFTVSSGDRATVDDSFDWTEVTSSSVTLDQRLSTNARVGDIFHVFSDGFEIWSDSTHETIPVDQYSTLTLRADRQVYSGEKYNNWSSLSDVTNHHAFQVNDASLSFTSHFAPVVMDAVITAHFVDLPGTTPDSVYFMDPWFVDFQDFAAGGLLRNQGMDAPFKGRSCPFHPNENTNYDGILKYNGVFLNQDYSTPGNPHYSIRVPSAKTISGTTFNFMTWTGNSASIDFQNATSCTTGVVFKQSGAIANARYKAPQRSSDSRASGLNPQRAITYANGKYHVVYPSGGDIWYLASTDNGGTWSQDMLLSDESGLNRQPSIAVRQSRAGGQSYLAVIWERYDGEYSDISVRYLESNSTWSSASVIWNGLMDQDCEGATPAMAMENSFEVAVWRVKSSSEWNPSGLYLWMSTDSGPYVIDGTGSSSMHPSIAVPAFQDLERRFAVAWSDNGQIYYKPFRWYHEELTSTATENPSSGSGLSQHDYPSLVYVSSYARRPALAWQAYSTYIEANVVLARERGTSSWGTIQQYSKDESYLHPSLTRHEYSDTSLVMAWHDGSNMYLAKRTTSWGSRTNLSSGRYPELGLDPDGDNTHFRIVYTTGASAPYQIATTSQGLPKTSAGDVEMRRIVALSNGAAYTVVLEKADILTSQSVSNLQMRSVDDPGKAFTPEESAGMASTTDFTVPRGARIRVQIFTEGSDERKGASHSGELAGLAQIIDASTGNLLAATPLDTVNAKTLSKKHSTYLNDLASLEGKEVRMVLVPAFKGKADLWTLTEIHHDTTGATPQGGIQKQINEEPKPQVFAMAECYPNPFNPITTISYELPTDGVVKLVIYDLLGREIAELASGHHVAGRYSATWNASSVASGVYFARLTVMDELGQTKFNKTAKLVLAK